LQGASATRDFFPDFDPFAGTGIDTYQPSPADERAAAQLKTALQKLPEVAALATQNPDNPRARKNLEDLLDTLEDLVNQLNDSPTATPQREELKQKAMAALAKMRPGRGTGTYTKDLLASAQDLAGCLAQLLAETQHGHSSLGLDKAIAAAKGKGLDKSSMVVLLSELDDLDKAMQKKKHELFSTSVEQTAANVAAGLQRATKHSILAQKDPNDPIIKSFDKITESFDMLAKAAASGSGEELIQAAKKLLQKLKH